MLRFIRSALHMLFLTVTVIPWSLMVVALSPFVSKQWLYGFCHVWVRMVVASARPLLGIRTRVRGLENLPAGPQAAAVLLVKHQSAWETFVLPTITPHPLAYIFKRELARIRGLQGETHDHEDLRLVVDDKDPGRLWCLHDVTHL